MPFSLLKKTLYPTWCPGMLVGRWLAGWLVGWLAGWLVVGWWVGRLVCWLRYVALFCVVLCCGVNTGKRATVPSNPPQRRD